MTDRCNLRCCYCMPAKGIGRVSHSELLSLEDLAQTVQLLCRELPIERIKLTGGEPLVRAGLPSLIRQLRAIPGIDEISLTTNGTLLARFGKELKSNGLARVNISLDSLDPETFAEVTRGGRLEETLEGIRVAQEIGLTPVKLNAVLRQSTWRRDIPLLFDFAVEHRLEVRLIELMRTGTEQAWCEREYVSASDVENELLGSAISIPVLHASPGPARVSQVHWHGEQLRVGWITPRSRPFCSRCNRLRMDSRGRIFRCLMDGRFLPFADIALAEGEEAALESVTEYLCGKFPPSTMHRTSSMALIGG
ncbi:MAG: radical SAM protein [Terracidiphilus sp.]|nr:radical SAM protein [Terracidiphilus sp.]